MLIKKKKCDSTRTTVNLDYYIMTDKVITDKDLMIGDWVESIYKHGQANDQLIGKICVSIHNLNDDYEYFGIPIDTDILEKNQFYHRYRRGNEPNYWGGINDTIKIEEHYNKFKVYIDTYDEDGDLNYIVCSCKYVHELQHIFKVLNIDKEIIL